MAVINKIRSRAGLLIGIVGFSLFAFILGDLLHNNKNLFGGDTSTVAVIAGKKINVQDFEAQVQTMVTNYKLNNNTETVDQNNMDQLREQAYTQLINDEVMGKQYAKIGLTVSSDELFDMVRGSNPHPQIKQAFTDSKTGVYNPSSVINFLKNMDNDKTGRTRAQWVVFEKAIQQERLGQKYNDLVKQGLYVPTMEAKDDFINKNRTASVRYVAIPYTSILDTTVTVTDAELKAVYNANLKRYKQVASRSIDYVTFDVNPSEIDRKDASDKIGELVDGFKTTISDSAFVALKSDSPFDGTFHKKGTLAPNIDSVMFGAALGTVVGPYEENGTFKLAKLSATKLLPDSVKASHILLKVAAPSQKAAVMILADSIKKAIQDGMPISILSDKYSTDQGAKTKGGDLGWFASGAMVKEFNDSCFEGKKGDVIVVETQFGIHILKIVDQAGSSRQIRVAFVTAKIEASSKTYQMVFTKANEFAAKNTTAQLFEKGIKDGNLTKLTEANINESTKQIGPLENSRELVKWAFNAKISDVSKAFEFGNKFAIGKLNDAREKGYSTIDQVKDQLTAEARKDKKAEMIIEKLKKSGNATNLDVIASSNKQVVNPADNVSFGNPFLGNAGMEGNVVGHIMTLKTNQVSEPLKGISAIYIVSVTSFKDSIPPKDLSDAAKQLRQQMQTRSQYEVFNALREKAEIDDRRFKFY